MDITSCPQCGAPAEVLWRDALDSTDGPVEHVKVQCVGRHWFLLTTDLLHRTLLTAAHAAASS